MKNGYSTMVGLYSHSKANWEGYRVKFGFLPRFGSRSFMWLSVQGKLVCTVEDGLVEADAELVRQVREMGRQFVEAPQWHKRSFRQAW